MAKGKKVSNGKSAANQRKSLIKHLNEDELLVEERKLKSEKNNKLLNVAKEREKAYREGHLTPEDPKHARELEDKKIEEGIDEGFITGEKAEEIYDLEEAEELVEDDEINAGEEGFVRGYEAEEEQHFSKKSKKKKR